MAEHENAIYMSPIFGRSCEPNTLSRGASSTASVTRLTGRDPSPIVTRGVSDKLLLGVSCGLFEEISYSRGGSWPRCGR